jgi:KAP family P-loop domain
MACRCLTARYVIPKGPALGTMLASFAGDMETVRNRQRDTRGDLVDQTQGAHWADFASRMASSPMWPDLINEQLPLAISVGEFAMDGPNGLLSIIGAVGADPSSSEMATATLLRDDERLVLLLDGDNATSDLTQLANALPRGVLLVVTSPPDRDLDRLTELIGPVMRLPRYEGAPPSSGRITYDKSALESDQPAEVDALRMDPLALTTAKLLMHESTGPICIGVEAPWGKGKSSFLKLVCEQAKRQAKSNPAGFELLPVDFNAWVYSNAEQAWAGLAVEVIEAVETKLGRWHRLTLRWRYAWQRRRGLLVGSLITALLAIGLAVSAAALAGWDVTVDSNQNPLALTFAAVSPAVVGLILLVGAAHRITRPVSQRVHEYLARPDHAVRRGYQNAVVDDLTFTLKALRRHQPKTRVVVMVDDLDRCAEDKVVEILQAINVVLARSKVYHCWRSTARWSAARCFVTTATPRSMSFRPSTSSPRTFRTSTSKKDRAVLHPVATNEGGDPLGIRSYAVQGPVVA